MPPTTTAPAGWCSGRALDRRLRVASATLLMVALLVVGVIVLSPGPPAPAGQQALHRWSTLWRLAGGRPDFLTFGTVEVLANVLMFVPIGLLGAAAVRPHRRRWVVAAAAAVSVAIEVVQSGIPERVSSVTDVLANTAGALLGVHLLARGTERRRAVGAPRGPGRASC